MPDIEELVRQAAREVDRTLIDWALSLSPLERLRASMRSAASLEALRDAKSNRALRDALHAFGPDDADAAPS